jgi:hypothetical protein
MNAKETNMTTYSIEIERPHGNNDSAPLSSKTDSGAKRQFRKWVNTAGVLIQGEATVYLAFRQSSGAKGWLIRHKVNQGTEKEGK